jgi:hypothetical protein
MNTKEYSKKTAYKKKHILLSKEIIFAATRGEERALQVVIQHYERYIDRLSSRELYDCYGNIYIYHDPVLKTELQNRLIAGVLKFRINE